jgi:hypothetical protein
MIYNNFKIKINPDNQLQVVEKSRPDYQGMPV